MHAQAGFRQEAGRVWREFALAAVRAGHSPESARGIADMLWQSMTERAEQPGGWIDRWVESSLAADELAESVASGAAERTEAGGVQ
jgi:hypothetical protein